MDPFTYWTDPTTVAIPVAHRGRLDGAGAASARRTPAKTIAPLAAGVAGDSPVLTAGTAGMAGIRAPRGAPL